MSGSLRLRPGRAVLALVCCGASTFAGCGDFGRPFEGFSSDSGTDEGGVPSECSPEPGYDAGVVSFAGEIQPLFDATCVGCHTVANPGAGQILQTGMSYMSIVGVPAMETMPTSGMSRIEPGEPDESYMVHKLQGTHLDAPALGSGFRMPLGWTVCFPATDIAMLRAWVQQGALEN